MFNTILVPTDGSTLSELALEKAIEFAKINPGSKIIGLSVAEALPTVVYEGAIFANVSEYSNQLLTVAEKYVRKIADAASAAGIPYETVVSQSSMPHEEIVRIAKKYKCDCIFMASHGRKGLTKLFLGSNAQKVITQSNIPVMVFRPDETQQGGPIFQSEKSGF